MPLYFHHHQWGLINCHVGWHTCFMKWTDNTFNKEIFTTPSRVFAITARASHDKITYPNLHLHLLVVRKHLKPKDRQMPVTWDRKANVIASDFLCFLWVISRQKSTSHTWCSHNWRRLLPLFFDPVSRLGVWLERLPTRARMAAPVLSCFIVGITTTLDLTGPQNPQGCSQE